LRYADPSSREIDESFIHQVFILIFRMTIVCVRGPR
jgi:hypothetical protein